MATDPLVRIPVPAGPAGLEALAEPLRAALAGTGPAIAPIPAVGATISEAYVRSLLRATAPGEPLDDDRTAVVLSTSGSTGSPKGVLLSADGLTALNPWRATPSTWVSAIPLTSAGGLNVLTRALAPGSGYVGIDSLGGARPFTPAGFATAVSHARSIGLPLRTSLVPAQVRRLLGDAEGIEALLSFDTILVGGAGLDPATRENAAAKGIALISTYGMTETCGGCVYDGQPLDGVTVTIDDESRVTIGGPSIALGYRLQPALTEAHFTSRGFLTSDLGTLVDGVLRIIGRMDDVVTVNGVNVSVAAVEALLREEPGVTDCAVVALDDPERGSRLVAFVCAGSDVVATLGDRVSDALGTAARPRTITTIESLPTLPGGKTDRQALIALARETP
jgi:O-succinylbenzoic acid--CoA ligase